MAGLYRRGKIWWGRAQRKGREHRRSLQTANRTIAEKRFRDWFGEIEAVAWGDKPRRSFKDAHDKFICEHLTMLKPGAAKRYGVSLKHLNAHFGSKMLHQITKAELSDFETKRRTEGVSAGTIRRDLACLSSLLTSCLEWEWIDEGANIVPGYLRRRSKRGLKEAPGRTRYLKHAEEANLLAHATDEPRKAMALAIDTGLRREELFSLKWSQVDLLRGTITTTTLTKNGRSRKVPLPARSAQILAQLPRRLDTPVRPGQSRDRDPLRADEQRAESGHAPGRDIGPVLARSAPYGGLPVASARRQEHGRGFDPAWAFVGDRHRARYAFLEAEAVAESLGSRTEPGTGTADVIAIKKAMQ